MLPEVFTLSEVASHLGVASDTIEREARLHGCCSVVGDRMLFTAPQVERLLGCWEPVATPKHHVPIGGAEEAHAVSFTFSVETLAKHWDVSTAQIRGVLKSGRLAHFRVGKAIRISAAEVERFEAEGNIATEAKSGPYANFKSRTQLPEGVTPQDILAARLEKRR